MIITRALVIAALGATQILACATLLGVDGFEPVDDVDGGKSSHDDGGADRTDGSSPDASGPPGTETTDASTDASDCINPPPCASGVRLVVRYEGSGTARLSSEPAGISVMPGETASACFTRGTRLRLSVAGEGMTAIFSGVDCEEKEPTDRCEFSVTAPVCVNAQLQ